MQTLSQASMTNRLKMQASEIGFDNHYKHPLMMAFNLKVSQASYPIILKQVPIWLAYLARLKTSKCES